MKGLKGPTLGNISNQRYEAEHNISRLLKAVHETECTRETSRWRESLDKEYKFEDYKREGIEKSKKKKLEGENDKIAGRLFDIMNETRKAITREYAPGWRIGACGTVIDCYAGAKNDTEKFASMHGRAWDLERKEKKREMLNMKLYENIQNARSAYAVDECEKNYQKNRDLARVLNNKVLQSTLHLGLVKAVKRKQKAKEKKTEHMAAKHVERVASRNSLSGLLSGIDSSPLKPSATLENAAKPTRKSEQNLADLGPASASMGAGVNTNTSHSPQSRGLAGAKAQSNSGSPLFPDPVRRPHTAAATTRAPSRGGRKPLAAKGTPQQQQQLSSGNVNAAAGGAPVPARPSTSSLVPIRSAAGSAPAPASASRARRKPSPPRVREKPNPQQHLPAGINVIPGNSAQLQAEAAESAAAYARVTNEVIPATMGMIYADLGDTIDESRRRTGSRAGARAGTTPAAAPMSMPVPAQRVSTAQGFRPATSQDTLGGHSSVSLGALGAPPTGMGTAMGLSKAYPEERDKWVSSVVPLTVLGSKSSDKYDTRLRHTSNILLQKLPYEQSRASRHGGAPYVAGHRPPTSSSYGYAPGSYFGPNTDSQSPGYFPEMLNVDAFALGATSLCSTSTFEGSATATDSSHGPQIVSTVPGGAGISDMGVEVGGSLTTGSYNSNSIEHGGLRGSPAVTGGAGAGAGTDTAGSSTYDVFNLSSPTSLDRIPPQSHSQQAAGGYSYGSGYGVPYTGHVPFSVSAGSLKSPLNQSQSMTQSQSQVKASSKSKKEAKKDKRREDGWSTDYKNCRTDLNLSTVNVHIRGGKIRIAEELMGINPPSPSKHTTKGVDK